MSKSGHFGNPAGVPLRLYPRSELGQFCSVAKNTFSMTELQVVVIIADNLLSTQIPSLGWYNPIVIVHVPDLSKHRA